MFYVETREIEAFQESFLDGSNEEEENTPPPSKKRRTSAAHLEELQSIKQDVKKILKISRKRGFPIGFINALEDNFSCNICKRCPPVPPLICCRACSSLVGCEYCVNQWYGTGPQALTKMCPNCREPRGYASTFELKGMSSLVSQINSFMHEESDDSDSDLS